MDTGRQVLDNSQPWIYYVLVINKIIEEAREYQIRVHFAFTYYTKGFDFLSHEYPLKMLRNQGIYL